MLSVNVIGGSGFIGTALVRRLVTSDQLFVNIIDKVPSKAYPDLTILGDVRSTEDLCASISMESVIVNLAAEHRDDVQPLSLYSDVNVAGAKNICTVAREKDVRTIIFTSTVAVYGFAPIGTDESGKINPFNAYGRTKYEAEKVFESWQAEAPAERTLVIIRPTVVFGEGNRGNVYNLLRFISSGKFLMVGSGENRKSMAYVENLAAFIEFSMYFKTGVHIYNFVDKPDLSMSQLVGFVKKVLDQPVKTGLRLPFAVGYAIAKVFDLVALSTGRSLVISSVRIKKFCANSVYNTAIHETGFVSPTPLSQALEQTIHHEFVQKYNDSISSGE